MASKFSTVPYVVLVGDVGSGKSTIMEKVCGRQGLSSSSNESFTKKSDLSASNDGLLVVADTPGSNAMKDKLSHNMEIGKSIGDVPYIQTY